MCGQPVFVKTSRHQLQLWSYQNLIFLQPIVVRLPQKKPKDRTRPDFKTLTTSHQSTFHLSPLESAYTCSGTYAITSCRAGFPRSSSTHSTRSLRHNSNFSHFWAPSSPTMSPSTSIISHIQAGPVCKESTCLRKEWVLLNETPLFHIYRSWITLSVKRWVCFICLHGVASTTHLSSFGQGSSSKIVPVPICLCHGKVPIHFHPFQTLRLPETQRPFSSCLVGL